nr:MAG: hypothetical protein BECKLPF1236A_GA0070988_105244 [Candidatus Kentron sp. LPFa]
MELNALYHCVASLDVHQAVVIVCIIYEDEAGKIHVQLREFGAFKRNRKAMAEWVASFQPQQVMESTGIKKLLFGCLESFAGILQHLFGSFSL